MKSKQTGQLSVLGGCALSVKPFIDSCSQVDGQKRHAVHMTVTVIHTWWQIVVG